MGTICAWHGTTQKPNYLSILLEVSPPPQAAEQGWDLLDALTQLWPASEGKAGMDWVHSKSVTFPCIRAVECEGTSEEAAPIVIGTVINLLISTAEASAPGKVANEFGRLAVADECLYGWLRHVLLVELL